MKPMVSYSCGPATVVIQLYTVTSYVSHTVDSFTFEVCKYNGHIEIMH